ncbi:hypothetical protein [Tenacibaculum sp.]|uniref:hypothetical protein n=1 Tax=Tenacibaculum sp. TaxID=1906242 RepID=UPI003D0ABA39
MKSKKNLLLAIFFITFCEFSFSQYDWTQGEIILKGGKVIEGLIKLPILSKNFVNFNGKSIVKLKNENGKKTKFHEHQVELIKFTYPDSKVAYYKYISVSKKRKEIFCIIITGKATLYGRLVGVSTSGPATMSFYDINEFYVIRNNEKIASPLITARPSKSFKKRSIKYFNDCPSLINKLKQKILTKKNIFEVVEEYNKCK